MKRTKYLFLILVIATACIGVYVKSELDGWFISSKTTEELANIVEPHITVFKPDGPGPFKTVLMFHGCGGRSEQQIYWGEMIKSWGYAAVYVNSYAGRNIDANRAQESVCSGDEFRGSERAGDVLTALAWSKRQTWVEHRALIVVGWSHGAWSVMDAFALQAQNKLPHGLTKQPDGNLADIDKVVLFYPYCGIASKTTKHGWKLEPDVLAIEVAEDTVVGAGVCENEFIAIENSTPIFEHEVFRGVDHAFDTDAISTDVNRTYRTPKAQALSATKRAQQHVKLFLER